MTPEQIICLNCVSWNKPAEPGIADRLEDLLQGYCLEHLDYSDYWQSCNEFSEDGSTIEPVRCD